MVAWCEEHLAAVRPAGGRRLSMYVHDYDTPRRRLLAERGWAESAGWGMIRRLRFGAWPVAVPDMGRGLHPAGDPA